jgi:hypothetical protein
MVRWLTKHKAAEITGDSHHTLKDRRLYGPWRQWKGVLWVQPTSRTTRYNEQLLQSWMACSGDAAVFSRAVENFQASLISNQPRKSGRKPKTAAEV